MLTRIRNAVRAGLPNTEIPGSRIKAQIVGILRSQGFIRGYELRPGDKGQARTLVDLHINEGAGLSTLDRRGHRLDEEVENDGHEETVHAQGTRNPAAEVGLRT